MTTFRLLPILLLAACATNSVISDSRECARMGDYARAFRMLDEARQQRVSAGQTLDPEFEAAYRAAHVAFLYARAEERLFEEDEVGALADVTEVEAMDPDYPGIADMRDRVGRKKAQRLLRRGEEALVRKDYVHSLASYLEAQALAPQNEEARDGIKAVMDATVKLSERAQEQFLEAVRKLPEFRYVEVQWHASNVIHNAPERDEAKVLQAKARREIALKAMARGRECERQSRFGAALIDYKTAKLTDPATPGVEEAIASMVRETKAGLLVDQAQMDMRAARFDAAREKLGQAFELSVMARNDIGALMLQVRKQEGERQYQAARDLEVLGKKSEALAAFEAVAKDWPDGVNDEKARIDALRVDIEGATTEWAAAEAAEAAGDLAKALDHYLNSERYYPGWKDGKERIAKLRAATARTPAAGARGNG